MEYFGMRIMILCFVFCSCVGGSKHASSERWNSVGFKGAKAYVFEHPLIDQEIITKGMMNPLLSDTISKVLSKKEATLLNKMMSKSDAPGEYAILECFEPHHGIVFYNESHTPVAWITICFKCNNIKASPPSDKADLADLRRFFEELDLPVFNESAEYLPYFHSSN